MVKSNSKITFSNKRIKVAKVVQEKNSILDINNSIKSLKATMALENMELTQSDIKDCKKILTGELTADDVCQKIIDKYTSNNSQKNKIRQRGSNR